MITNNKYDYLLILLIAILIFGYYGTPLYPSRLLALAISPLVLKEISRKSVYIPSYVICFFVIWIFMGVVSLLWSYDRVNGFKALFYFFCNIISFFSLYVFGLKAKNPILSILTGWSLLFVLTIPFAIYEFSTGNHFITLHSESLSLLDADGIRVFRRYASVTYGNLNKYNVIICLCLPYILASFFWIKNKKYQFFHWIVLLAVTYIVLMNASRGALLCMVMAFGLFMYYMLKQNLVNRVFVLVMLMAVAYVLYVNFDLFFGQMLGRLAESKIAVDDSRTNIYSRAIHILIDTCGLGVGIGGVNQALRLTTVSGIAAMHNMFLEFLIQFGVIPFIFYIRFISNIYIKLVYSRDFIFKFLGKVLIVTAIPMFIINSNYLMDTDMWLFLGSAFALLMVGKT